MKLLATSTVIAMITISGTTQTFAQTFYQRGSQTSQFKDSVKCLVLGQKYKHFLFLEPNSDQITYKVGETTNLNRANPFADYTTIESYASARNLSYERINFKNDTAVFYTDWSFAAANFELHTTISTDYAIKGSVYFDSKLNKNITSNRPQKVVCFYE